MKRRGMVFLVFALLAASASSVNAQVDYFETAKPAAKSTPVQDATNGMEPIPLADGLEIPYFYFVQDGDDVVVYGEVIHSTPGDKLIPDIEFSFLDASGSVYLTASVAANNDFIPEGGRIGFQGLVIDTTLRVGDWDSVVVSAGSPSAFDLDYFDLSPLKIKGASITGSVIDGQSVAGLIRNEGSQPLLVSELVIEYRDSSGMFVGSCSDYLDVAIPAGAFVRFSIELRESGICGFQYPAIRQSNGAPFSYSLIPHRFRYT